MSIRNLGQGEMIAVAGAWTGPQRELFLTVPEIAGFMLHVERVHKAVLSAEKASAAPADRKTIERLSALDARHDNAVRALWHLIEGTVAHVRASETPDEEQANALLSLREKLFPAGLSTTQQSYLEESGAAERAKQLLDASAKSLLKGQRVGDETLLAVFRLYTKVAEQLGALEREKQEAAAKEKSSREASTILSSRNDWVRVVRQVLDALELSNAPADTLASLRGSVDAVLEKAARRRKSEESEPAPDATKA